MKWRSEWQSPATLVRISTSRGPGLLTLTSSITSGLLTSYKTAAFIGVRPCRLWFLRVKIGYAQSSANPAWTVNRHNEQKDTSGADLKSLHHLLQTRVRDFKSISGTR